MIKSLTYDEIFYRVDQIPRAYQKTFQWVFQASATTFPDWLRDNNDTFWISGKAGSGKSTLMKYLSSHPDTKSLLGDWAAGKELLLASHYFWTAGTSMQKSLTGLLRSLLFQILEKCPQLAIIASPARCAAGNHAIRPWTDNELVESLLAIAALQPLPACFCFFIDGLDEYNGEHAGIIKIFSDLAKSPFVKICASSRPWNVFHRPYGQDHRKLLIMQDLTKSDIEAYINGTLMADSHFLTFEQQSRGAKDLIQEIAVKAQGVFLWVFLVVRNLLAGLIEGDDIKILHERIKEFPPSLEEYYQRMFESLHKVYRKESARIILTTMHWNPKGKPPADVPIHLCTEITQPNYAWTMPLEHDKVQDIAKIRMHLNARCRDLLEIQRVDDAFVVEFLHRTARDFLQNHEMYGLLIDYAAPGFDVHISISKAIVATLKTTALYKRQTKAIIRSLFVVFETVQNSKIPECKNIASRISGISPAFPERYSF